MSDEDVTATSSDGKKANTRLCDRAAVWCDETFGHCLAYRCLD